RPAAAAARPDRDRRADARHARPARDGRRARARAHRERVRAARVPGAPRRRRREPERHRRARPGRALRSAGERGRRLHSAAAAVEAHKTLAAPGHSLVVLDRSGRVMAGTWKGPNVDESIVARGEPVVWTAATPDGAWRAHLRPTGDRAFLLFVAVPLTDVL